MPTVTWRGQQFSMRPVDPAVTEDNPATRVLNMAMRGNGQLRKRFASDTTSSLPAGTQNHIVAELNGTPFLIVKDGPSIRRTSGGGFSAISYGSLDPPIGSPATDERGSFSIFGGELYYCDSRTVVAWNGQIAGTFRRPGVTSLDGRIYNVDINNGTSFGVPDAQYGPPFGPPPIPDPLNPAQDPYLITIVDSAGNINLAQADLIGEKTLNTAFAFSYYDPIRNIHGRRSEAFALPYLFAGGPPPPSNIPQVLSNVSLQYSKIVKTPDVPPGHPDYKVAIWFTRGFVPIANTGIVTSGQGWAVTLWSPAMSKRMNEILFLEGIFEPNLTGAGPGSRAVCKKDDTTLFASGRYIDVHGRPVPARFMVILPNGTAVYFFPRAVPTRAAERIGDSQPDTINSFPLGNYAEFSIGHPEQIGRNTDTQRDTRSPIANLKGDIIQTISDGINNMLFTRVAIYRVGFDGVVVLAEVADGRGVKSPNSIASSAMGILYMAEEGVVWLRGNQTILLDKKLGFGEWFDRMADEPKSQVVIGTCDTLSQILVYHVAAPGTGPAGQRAMVYDAEHGFASEFRGSDVNDVTYAAFFRRTLGRGGQSLPGGGGVGSQLWTTRGRYPAQTPAQELSEVELWISESLHRPKHLGIVEVKLGPRTGTITVRVESHDHPDRPTVGFSVTQFNTTTIPGSSTTGTKVRLTHFIGMRGRMFRILLSAGTATDWGLQEVTCEYEIDESEDIRST